MTFARAIRRPAVIAMTGLSATTIHNLEKQGKFPKHWLQTPRCAVWDESEVAAFMEARRERPAAPAPIPDQADRKRRPGRGRSKAARVPNIIEHRIQK